MNTTDILAGQSAERLRSNLVYYESPATFKRCQSANKSYNQAYLKINCKRPVSNVRSNGNVVKRKHLLSPLDLIVIHSTYVGQ